MDVSIVILNFKTKNFLKQCIRQLKEMDVGVNYEIIVIDSHSQDGSVEMMKECYPEIDLTAATENLGFHKGNNIGIKKAKGKYVMILNTDIFFIDSQAIKKMFDYLESNSKVALVGPQLLNPDKTIQKSVMRYPTIITPFCRRMFIGKTKWGSKELARFEMHDWDHNSTRDVDWIFGACTMVRKETIDQVGMMGEYLFLYYGDTDWARRFWKNGWEVHYLSDAKAIHLHRRESADSSVWQSLFSPVARMHIKDWINYMRKWGLSPERPKNN